jgi:hypothetical protein
MVPINAGRNYPARSALAVRVTLITAIAVPGARVETRTGMREVERLIEALKQNRSGHRDATAMVADCRLVV